MTLNFPFTLTEDAVEIVEHLLLLKEHHVALFLISCCDVDGIINEWLLVLAIRWYYIAMLVVLSTNSYWY